MIKRRKPIISGTWTHTAATGSAPLCLPVQAMNRHVIVRVNCGSGIIYFGLWCEYGNAVVYSLASVSVPFRSILFRSSRSGGWRRKAFQHSSHQLQSRSPTFARSRTVSALSLHCSTLSTVQVRFHWIFSIFTVYIQNFILFFHQYKWMQKYSHLVHAAGL